MLRVLVLARSYPNDALPTLGVWTERLTLDLAKACQVEVVSPVPYCPPVPQLSALRGYSRFRGVARHELRALVPGHHPRFVVGPGNTTLALEASSYYHAARRRIARIRERFPFDLVHAHFIYPDGVAAQRIAAEYGVPLVVTEHAPWRPLVDARGIARQVIPAALSAAALTAVSNYVRRTMEGVLPAPRLIDLIPNAVDGRVFTKRSAGEPRDRNQILFVGQVNYNKGIDVLLTALPKVAAVHPDVRLVIVGGSYYRRGGDQERQLRARATELGLGRSVSFVGHQDSAAVAQLMRRSAMLVLPSRAETFGVPLIETLASGTPVVSTRSGGPEDIVTPDVGELVEPGDQGALADAIVRVLRRGDAYVPAKLRAYALSRFGIGSVVARLLDVYERSALKRGAHSAELASDRT